MGGGIFCKPLVSSVSGLFGKFCLSRLSLAGKVPKLLRHCSTKRKCAFTLAEVLIVLAVLGVIAAMTIPTLIQDAREKALITALKKNYSIFSQAVDMAVADNGPINTWNIDVYGSQTGALKLFDILKPYLKIQEYCGTKTGCFADHYEALFNKNFANQPATSAANARGVLASGASLATGGMYKGVKSSHYGVIMVDVNGKSGPNKAGVDFFEFNLSEDGLIPRGQKSKANCIYNDSNVDNGKGCTHWAIKHGNMDYLRKAGNYYGN